MTQHVLFIVTNAAVIGPHSRKTGFFFAEVNAKQRAWPVTDSGDELAGAPGPHDGTLHRRIALDVHHRPETARHQDGIVVGGVHLGQFAAVI